jgi:signal transduction histidine kinase
VDLPTSRRRPDKAALDTLNVYARLAERAVVNFVRSHLINVLSHELQTPVTVILGRADLALENATDPRRRDDLQAISRAAQRISDMSEDLLVMARVGDPDNPVDATTVDLGALVSECARLFSDMAAQQRIELVVSVPDQAVTANGSSVELEAMVSNLLSNAVKYSDPGGRVQVAVHSGSPGWVELSVSDDGIGISEEDQREIFDEFFRSSSPDVRARPGSGLGLAIVDRIIRRHNGRIQIRSELALGMTVRVELPSPAPAAPPQPGEAASVPAPSSQLDARGRRV